MAEALVGHILSLDLGQTKDPSALTVLERREEQGCVADYDVRQIKRWPLGTKYPSIVADVVKITQRPELIEPVLVIDQTGVGRPVVDEFELQVKCAMRAVTITAGATVNSKGIEYHVPKKDIVGCLLTLFGYRRLRIAPALPLAGVFIKELENFRVKVTQAANETFSAWREGDHDDIVLACGIGCWIGENTWCGGASLDQPEAATSMMSKLAGEMAAPGVFAAERPDSGDVGSGEAWESVTFPWR